MFQKVSVPILGLVENMSAFVCPNCSHIEQIFGEGGGQSLCNEYDIDFLGSLPLNTKIRQYSDDGNPIMVSYPDSISSKLYSQIAKKISKKISAINKDFTSKFPKIIVKNN